MNFHISPLSPLRPRYPTTLGPSSAARSPGRSERQHHQHHQHHQREPDDDDQDDGTDHYHLHLRAPHTPVGRAPGRAPLGRPKIEVDGAADDELVTSTSGSGTDSSSDSGSSSEGVSADEDSRDVLVQRLNDLAQRLSAANVRTGNVEALHAQVDEMERVLTTGGGSRSTSRHSSSAARRKRSSLRPGPRDSRSMVLPPGGGNSGDAHGLMGPPLSPSWLLSQFQRQPSISIHRDEEHGGRGRVNGREGDDIQDQTLGLHNARPVMSTPTHLHPSSIEQPGPLAAAAAAAATTTAGSPSRESYEMADTIVQEAEGLCAEMASVIASLQKRREESDHLHAILVQREGAADKLILEQAARIGELEDTVAEDESELRYLKIQLRGIEAQCLGYIPKGADPELDQSIRSWKKDWTSLRDRWVTRRGSSFVSGDESSTFSNSTTPAPL